jgi:hypothetical protein
MLLLRRAGCSRPVLGAGRTALRCRAIAPLSTSRGGGEGHQSTSSSHAARWGAAGVAALLAGGVGLASLDAAEPSPDAPSADGESLPPPPERRYPYEYHQDYKVRHSERCLYEATAAWMCV